MALLLDTCAMIWISKGEPVAPAAREAVERELAASRLTYVSPISAWEIGLLAAGNRISLTMPPMRWFSQFMNRRGLALADLTPDILIAASYLPGALHRDPVDRIICATARESGHIVVTRDRKILDYAAAGHCRAMAC